MAEEQPVIHVSTIGLVITVAMLLGTVVALATINPGIAIVFVIFAFIFGDDILRFVTIGLGEESGEREREADGPEDALEILRRRYANGELSDDEFERRLDRLVEVETVDDAERYLEERAEWDDAVRDDPEPREPSRGRVRDRDRDVDLERS